MLENTASEEFRQEQFLEMLFGFLKQAAWPVTGYSAEVP
jgi:hypothetical protein